ncbi:MAG: hypothetical protein L3K13_06500 [Thermoplasmata archaeon]|nr:hypothetical protein [Thermoplasmata archaeon]
MLAGARSAKPFASRVLALATLAILGATLWSQGATGGWSHAPPLSRAEGGTGTAGFQPGAPSALLTATSHLGAFRHAPPLVPHPLGGGGAIPAVSASLTLFNGTVASGTARATPNDAPGAIASDRSAARLYVADEQSGMVTVVNLSSAEVVGSFSFPTGGPLTSLAVDNRSGELYGVDASHGYVDAVNLSGNHSTAAELAVSSPEEVVYEPSSGDVLITSGSPDRLLVYNGTNHTLLASYATTGTPAGIAVDAAASIAYVASSSSNSVDRIDLLNGSVQNLPVGTDPTGLAVDTAHRTLFVANTGSDTVSLVNLTTLAVSTVSVGRSPAAVLYDGATERVYVANSAGDNVSVLNGTNGTRPTSLAVGTFPEFLAADNSRSELYISATSTYNITVLNSTSGKVSGEITVGSTPSLVSWVSGNSSLLVSDAHSRWGYLVNGSSLTTVALPLVGTGDLSSAVAPSIGKLFLASAVDNRIWSLFLANGSLASSAMLPYGPVSLAYDSATDRLFAADPTASSVEVFDPGTLQELGAVQFPTPAANVSLSGLAVDPSTEQLYVAEHAAGKVAVVNTSTLRFMTNLTILAPSALAFVYTSNRIAVVSGSNLVFVNALTRGILASVRLGSPAGSVTFSPTTGDVYVGSATNSSIQVVQPNPAVARGNISLGAVAGQPGLDQATGTLWIPEPSLGVIAGAPTAGANPLWIRNLSASPESIPVGVSMNFTTSVVGGLPPYRYLYSGLPAGCVPLNRTRLPCSPVLPGNFTVRLEVKDAAGNSTNSTVSLNVSALPVVLVQAFTATPANLDVGASTTLRVSASANFGGVSYSYLGLPPGCLSANTSSLACRPSAIGSFLIRVTVTGVLGIRANASLPLSVFSDPYISSFQGTLLALDAGGTTLLSVLAAGGSSSFSYVYGGLPTGCASANTTNLSCRPTGAGNFTVTATATDSVGGKANATLSLKVTPATVIGSFSATPGAVDVGQEVTLLARAGGGAGFLAFTYAGLPVGCNGGNVSTINCAPSAPGNYTVTVSVRDALAPPIQRSLQLKVALRPQIASFSASPANVETGGSVLLTVIAGGGTGFLTYSYLGLPSSCGIPSTANVDCQVGVPGTYTATVTVTDSAQVSANASAIFHVLPQGAVHPAIESFVASSTEVTVGQALVLTVRVSNTSASFSFAYAGLPTGCASSDSTVLSCTPTGPGVFTVTVTVQSPYGGSARQSLNLTILPAASIGGTSSRASGLPLFSLTLAGALGLFAILLALLYRQQRRRASQPTRAIPRPAPPAVLPEAVAVAAPIEEPAPVEEPPQVVVEPVPAAPADPLTELEAELDILSKELSESSPEGPSGPGDPEDPD